jgi:hypothetical protein
MLKPINFTVEDFEICPIKGDDLDRFDIMADEVYDILSDEQTLRYIPEKRLRSYQMATGINCEFLYWT